ncbi:MAG: ATP-binding cassette domain-containing protein [Eubacterium sp.]|nr:ATP-binding cassette domain-containing protein [Eubacterium sp.]
MSIELKSVSYTYAPNTAYFSQALDNVSLTIHDGEFVGIMGKTGCGKSTLIQLMDGLLKPSQGNVLFDGQDINLKKFDRRILRQSIAVVFQFPDYQLFETTVERDIAFALKHARLSKSEVKERVIDALGAVGFDYNIVKDKSPLSFSGGEKRKLAIAGALAVKPKYLIFDEPIAGLDPVGREAFLQLIDNLNLNGTAIIMISHNADALAEHASRIVLMDNGKVVRDGKTAEVLSDYMFLRASGAATGQISNISRLLCEKGINIPKDTVKYNQLLDELCRIYGRDGI